jgi:pimeloyl-ACP methyl ester carboxylesterase
LQVHGALDPTVAARSAQGSDRYVEANYQWQLIAGVGHFPHEEDPDTFTRVLLEWLDDATVDE